MYDVDSEKALWSMCCPPVYMAALLSVDGGAYDFGGMT